MINLIKETLNRVLPKNNQISIPINRKDPHLILFATIDWDRLIQIIRNARELNGKQNRGPDPHYRELAGALLVLALESCTLRKAMNLIQYHIVYRIICNLQNSSWTPDFRTIHDFVKSLGEEGLKRVNEYFLEVAHCKGILDLKSLCADTTAQESSIPYPTEIGLSHQFIKSIASAIVTVGGKLGNLKSYTNKKLEEATNLLKHSRFFAKTKEEKRETLKELIDLAKKVQKHVKSSIKHAATKTISSLKGHKKRAFYTMSDLIETFGELSPQMDYFARTGKVAKNKIVSLFQNLIRSIPRGKDGKETEFGLKWGIAQVGGYIFGFSNGSAYDGDYAVEAIKEQKRIFGEIPKSFGFDRGGWSEDHINDIKILGVKNIGIAPKGNASWLVDKKEQKKIFCERSQIEGKIGTIKGYGFNKPRSKTSEGMLRTGQLAIIRFNLEKLSRDITSMVNL